MASNFSSTNSYPNLSLSELAANAVLKASKRLDEKKIPLSYEAQRRVHSVWTHITSALPDTLISQIMHKIENDITVQLAPQQPGEAIDLSSKVTISDNQITALPESFRNLGQLYHLFLIGNQITVRPKWISQVPNAKL